ncbi:MAG TPA: gamma-glutamylcyclotransferase [Acetobacteraceae bacterium]|nr:gamma-glutamylcyclotransferase [Acetobacteraceae bacterium]
MSEISEDPAAGAEFRITRQALADGSLLARMRALRLPGLALKSDAEIEASLDAVLATHPPGTDAFVFGYGSLMWNPAFAFAARHLAILHGWHRRFCLRMPFGRGTPERPGLMMALDRGGSCRGIVFRIAAAHVRDELLLVWRREMSGTAYRARWVTVRTAAGNVRAVTFVVDHAHPRYVRHLTEDEIADTIAHAAGPLGSCASYLSQTIAALSALGVTDHGLERLAAEVADRA